MTVPVQLLYSLSVLAFLFFVALYCLALAYLNRSRRPILVSGVWDCIGLLFGLSGFLLGTAPALIVALTVRVLDQLPGGSRLRDPLLWVGVGYCTALAFVSTLMLAMRRHRTAVYNVDTERFGARLAIALADLGLDWIERSGRLIIAPAEAFSTVAAEAITADPARVASTKTLRAPPGGPRYAELTVDPFPAFCHVTLHWDHYTPQIRREIESQLSRTLADAVAVDNPVAGWFLGFSGLIFGTVIMFALLVTASVLWRQH